MPNSDISNHFPTRTRKHKVWFDNHKQSQVAMSFPPHRRQDTLLGMTIPTRRQSRELALQRRISHQLYPCPTLSTIPKEHRTLLIKTRFRLFVHDIQCLRRRELLAPSFAETMPLQHVVGVVGVLEVGPGARSAVATPAFALAAFFADPTGSVDVGDGDVDLMNLIGVGDWY